MQSEYNEDNVEEYTEGPITAPYIFQSFQELKNKLPHHNINNIPLINTSLQHKPMIILEEKERIESLKARYEQTPTTSCFQTKSIEELIMSRFKIEENENIMKNEEEVENILNLKILRRIGKKLIETSNIVSDIRRLIKLGLSEESKIQIKKVPLERTDGEAKKYLILDLDNTLIQGMEPIIEKRTFGYYAKSVNIGLCHTSKMKTPYFLRPYLINFLVKMKELYHILVFTAADNCYANDILNHIEFLAKQKIFHSLFARKHLQILLPQNLVLKTLPENVDESQIFIVDDKFSHWFLYPDNIIPIQPFFGNLEDTSLILLGNYLKKIALVEDVREVNRQYLKVAEIFKEISNNIDENKQLIN